MENKLPDRIFGKSTVGAYEKFLKSSKKSSAKKKKKTSKRKILTPADIKGEDYIQIPNTNSLIARVEVKDYKGKTWDETHYALAENGLYMPTPNLFMNHFLYVRDAAEGNTTLYDGNNNPIPKNEIEDLWKYLTTDHRGGCWTWLDAKFIEGSGALDLDIITDHRVVQKGTEKTLEGTQKPLEACIQEDCYVTLNPNSQGLPDRKSIIDEYKQSKNIYFWHLRKDKVAGFIAGSDRAGLDCSGDPGGSSSGLGVFAYAEGTKKT